MTAFAFDTLKFAETLKKAGVPEKQAKAFVIVVQKSHENTNLTTKQDIAQLRHEMSDSRKDTNSQYELLRHEVGDLRKDVEILRKDMDVKYESLHKDMDTKYESLRKDIDTKYESLSKDMDTKYGALRKDMDVSYESLQHQIKELGLQLTIRLGTIVVAVVGILPLILKLLHLS